jgi:hypothetical protein
MSTTQTLGLSFAMGSCLLGITLLLGWLSNEYKLNANLLKWLLLPTLGYCIALGLNLFMQYVSCGKVFVEQIALGSIPVLVSILIFLLLTLVGFVRAPIQSAVPLVLREKYGGILSIGFYMFWAGMFGEAISGGIAQGCGKSP